MTAQPDWTLQDFVSELDAWVEAEHPTDDLRVLVTNWIFTRISDPFVNARRVAGFEDYWEVVVPHSDHFDDCAQRCGVICLYWLNVGARTVCCDRFASLSLPV